MLGHDSVTLSLAAKESREHFTPDMTDLKAQIASRRITIHASPLSSSSSSAPAPQSPPPTASSPPPPSSSSSSSSSPPSSRVLCTKVVHFLRHGQGFHNLLADLQTSHGQPWTQFEKSPNNPYTKPEVTDSPLTHKGRLQAVALRPLAEASGAEVVVTSTLCRAVQTALLAFEHLRGEASPASKGDDKNSAAVVDGGVGRRRLSRFVAHELVREESGVHLCDARRPVSSGRLEFPDVDWSTVSSDSDPIFDEARRESKGDVGERIYAFLIWLKDLEETNVAVATHSGWLVTLFNAVLQTREEDGGLREWFQTGEMRSVTLTWMERDE